MIQPIRSGVLVKPFESDVFSSGGIEVPLAFRARNNKATIVAVGNGVAKREMAYHAGQVVHHVKDAGQEIIENGEKMFIIQDIDILAVD